MRYLTLIIPKLNEHENWEIYFQNFYDCIELQVICDLGK